MSGPGAFGDVVISGLGVVSPFGCGRQALAAGLSSGLPRTHEMDNSSGYHRRGGARTACLTSDVDLSDHLSPRAVRRMSPPSQLAVAATHMALEDAGLLDTVPLGPEAAVVMATAFGPPGTTEKLLRSIITEGPEAASPFLFMESVANAPAAQMAIAFGLEGPSWTIAQRSVGPLQAVARAASLVAQGKARYALAGAFDEANPLLHAVLDRFGGLARSRNGDGTELSRPFDRHRDGFLLGEGATVLVLERESTAAERGATVLARPLGAAAGFDPSAPAYAWGTGVASLQAGIIRCLRQAGLEPADVDRIVASASGTKRGDRLEAGVLRAVWGERPLPPVLAPKGVTGEYGGGHLASAVLAAMNAPFGALAGFRTPDPELGVVPHDGSSLAPPRYVLAGSLAAGGSAAWLALERGADSAPPSP